MGQAAVTAGTMTPNDPTPWGPTWYAATMLAARERDALAQDIDVDVCVIGGGLAGLTTARELARRGWSVAVLEARRVAWNASGRNAGLVAPGFAERLETIVERVGIRRARELWALSAAGVDYVRAAIRDADMPGIDPVDGRLTVWRTDDEEGVLRHVAMLRVDLGIDAEAWPTERVRDVLRTPLYFQAAHVPSAFHIHALNYAQGLARGAESAGAQIYEETPVLALDVLGVRKRIETPNGRVRADHVVLAGGAHLGAIFPLAAGTVVPVASYIATTAPLGERLRDAIRYDGAVTDTRRAGDYYRVIGGDRLMWGGRITTRLTPPRWLKALMRRDIARVYPQLGDVEIEHAWSGVMSYAVHKMPQIGELSPGVWLASAFGGHGLNTTAMAGELIARAIVERDDTWRLFSAYELVWAGGRFGRPAAQVHYWSLQMRDTVGECLSRYRETVRRRAIQAAADQVAARHVAEVTANRLALSMRQSGAEAAHQAPARRDAVAVEPVAADVDTRHAIEVASGRAAQAIAQAFAEARSRATTAPWASPDEDRTGAASARTAATFAATRPQRDAADAAHDIPADPLPHDPRSTAIGDFAPQVITPDAPGAAEEPMFAVDAEQAPRRRRRPRPPE
jgi:glycine/D-amino acid oxidase-like deaminating enzyme